MFVKSLVILMFSLFAVSALGALPAESAPPIFVEQEDGSLVLESGTIAIEQTDGSLILARGASAGPGILDEERDALRREIKALHGKKTTLKERILKIFFPFDN